MRLVDVHAHKYRDRRFANWASEVAGRWKIEDLRADPGYCHDWISFDCLAWHAPSHTLYAGLAAIDCDICQRFDPATRRFTSLGYQSFADRFDAKFHRSLEIDDDGKIYAATALLHDMDQQHQAPGGRLVRYDPAACRFDLLAIPVPPHYIQSIVLDRVRHIIYGFTYPGEYLFRFDLLTGTCRTLAFIGNGVMMCQPHCGALDRQGRLWGTWGENRAFEDEVGLTPIRIFCYDPDGDRFTWFQHGFPKRADEPAAQVDHMLLAQDGLIYVGTVAGHFARLDPTSGAVEDLGRPYPGRRLAGLVQTADGLIYGAGNSGFDEHGRGTVRLFVYDPCSRRLDDLGRLLDAQINDGPTRVHMLVPGDDGVLYAGENDNTLRSSYLWECHLAG
jgi:hypothetical protein